MSAGAVGEPAGAATVAGDCVPGPGWPAARADLANRAIELVNVHRVSLGLRALVVSPALTTAAEWKARHMAQHGYIGHADPAPPVARGAAERFAACGYRAAWGENLAFGQPTAATVVAAWLSSPGHRANIEHPGYVAVGAAAARGPAGIAWSQAFGTAADAPPPPTTTSGSTPRLTLRGATLRPRPPRAGGTVAASVAVRLGGRRVAGARVSCAAAVAQRRLRVVSRRYTAGRARCVWRVPRTARGKLLHASIAVHRSPAHARAPFTARVR